MSSQVAFGGRELAHWPRLERGGDGLPIILACLGLSATGQLTAARCPAAAGWSAAAGRGATCCVGSPSPASSRRVAMSRIMSPREPGTTVTAANEAEQCR